MEYAAIGAVVLGTVLSTYGQVQAADAADAQGKAQQDAANAQARDMEIKAGQERALAQRQAIADRRKQDLLLSRSQALAAASGAGASDPTVFSNEGRIVREGELGALNDLYKGEDSGRALEEGAGLKRFDGAQAAYAGAARGYSGRIEAYGSLLSSAGSLYSKYGPAKFGESDFGDGTEELPEAMKNISTGVGAVPY